MREAPAPREGSTIIARIRPAVTQIVLPILGTVALIAAWWAGIVVLHIESYLAPTPPQVLDALVNTTGYLASNTVTTLLEVVQGYLLAVALGITVGGLLAVSGTLERAFMPGIVAVNAVPKLAFAPLLLVWMGFGQGPKIVMVVLLCTFPILLASVAGLTRTPAELIELANSLSASRWQVLIRFRMPSALPQIFVGLKTAMPLAVIGALVGELAGATAGLGFVIQTAGADTATAFAAITLLAVISVGLFYVLVLAERLLLPWARAITD